MASSSEVSAIPTAPVTPPITPPSNGGGGGGGGGGGNGTPSPTNGATKITLKGLAYPLAKIVILKDASIGAQVTADADGNFQS